MEKKKKSLTDEDQGQIKTSSNIGGGGGLGFTTPEPEEKKRPGRKPGAATVSYEAGGGATSDGEGGKILGKRPNPTSMIEKKGGLGIIQEGISSFPPMKRKRGRPAKKLQKDFYPKFQPQLMSTSRLNNDSDHDGDDALHHP